MFLGRVICFHASNLVHTYHHVQRILYTILLLFSLQIVVHMCSYTLTIVCMFSVHACACINSMFLGRAICLHASNLVHTYHHVHRIMYTILLLFSLQIVVHISVLHGPGLGPRAGPQPMGRAGSGFYKFAGRAGCGPETCRPGPGPGW